MLKPVYVIAATPPTTMILYLPIHSPIVQRFFSLANGKSMSNTYNETPIHLASANASCTSLFDATIFSQSVCRYGHKRIERITEDEMAAILTGFDTLALLRLPAAKFRIRSARLGI